jgi:TP901 family phage tail tape measure protein
MSASGIRMGRVFVEIGADTSKFFGQIQSLNAAMGKIGKSAANVGSQMMQFGAVLAAPIGLAVRHFAKFDDAIRATAAVTGLLGPEGAAALQMLNDKARELGATTSFTAVEVANLMTELGRAGFKPDEINGMTGAVLDLARATGTDATRSAGIMAATLRQFGLDAGDAAHAADILTYAANSTFNTVDSLGESLKYAGPVAKSLGMSLEDTTAILGVLGNVGIQGSEAGTALRRLSVISAGAGDELQQLFGVTNTDAAGELKPLVQILDEINTATANMPVAERTKRMAKAFGLLGITSANVLSSSAGGVKALSDGMKTVDGTAQRTAKAMDAGLGGAIRITLSAIEGTALAIGDSLAPSMQKLVEFIGNAATSLTGFIKDNKALVVQFAQGVAAFVAAGAGLFVFGKSLSMVSTLVGVALGAIGSLAGVTLSLLSPVGLLASGVLNIGRAFVLAIPSVVAFGVASSASMLSAGRSVAVFAASGISSLAVFGGTLQFAARGVMALASDIGRLAAPMARPFILTAQAASSFAVSVASSMAAYVASIATAVAATVASNARIAYEWSANVLKSVWTFVSGVAAAMSAYIGSIVMAVSATVTSAAAIAGAWLSRAFPATAAFVASAAASLGTYIASTVAAAVASVTNAARIGVAWLASGLPGLAAFVAGAVSGLAVYLGAASMAVAGSVISGAAVAAAWLAPLAPFALIAVAIGGVAALVSNFGGIATKSLGIVTDVAGQAGSAMSAMFGPTLAAGVETLTQIGATASTTFAGIYEAITAGDLVGAMDILWLGLQAGWLRGVAGLMNFVDPWIEALQNVFADLGTNIYLAWDNMWTAMATNDIGAIILGAFDNIANAAMATFDWLVGSIQKAWIRLQGFLSGATDVDAQIAEIDAKNKKNAEERGRDRPGIEGRRKAAAEESDKIRQESADRQQAVKDDAQAAKDARAGSTAQRRTERDAAASDAEGRLATRTAGAQESRIDKGIAEALIESLSSAKSMDDLTNIGQSISALIDRDAISGDMVKKVQDAYNAAAKRIGVATDASAASGTGSKPGGGGAGGGGSTGPDLAAAAKSAEVAGTFSSVNLGGMGFGSSLAERTAKAAEETAKNTRRIGEEGAVAA